MKDARFRCLCLIMFMSICGIAGAQQKANYQLGEKFRLLTQNPISKYSTSIHPTFINDTDCFYYSFTTSDGKNIIMSIHKRRRNVYCLIPLSC